MHEPSRAAGRVRRHGGLRGVWERAGACAARCGWPEVRAKRAGKKKGGGPQCGPPPPPWLRGLAAPGAASDQRVRIVRPTRNIHMWDGSVSTTERAPLPSAASLRAAKASVSQKT